jgi:hypothetical protein
MCTVGEVHAWLVWTGINRRGETIKNISHAGIKRLKRLQEIQATLSCTTLGPLATSCTLELHPVWALREGAAGIGCSPIVVHFLEATLLGMVGSSAVLASLRPGLHKVLACWKPVWWSERRTSPHAVGVDSVDLRKGGDGVLFCSRECLRNCIKGELFGLLGKEELTCERVLPPHAHDCESGHDLCGDVHTVVLDLHFNGPDLGEKVSDSRELLQASIEEVSHKHCN